MGIGKKIGTAFVVGSYAVVIPFLGWAAIYCITDKKDSNPSSLVKKIEMPSQLSRDIVQKMFPEDYNLPLDKMKNISQGYTPKYKCFKE